MKKRKIKILISGMLATVVILGTLFSCFSCDASTIEATSTFYSSFSGLNTLTFYKSNKPSGPATDPVWSPENVKYEDGKLRLAIDNADSKLTTGEVCTWQKFGYGLYQVSMKPIKNPGVVSSFFIYSQDGTEIDIEFLGNDTTQVQFNYHTDGVGGHEYFYDLGFDASEEYHNYAFYWTEDGIYWYVDNQPAYEIHPDDNPTKEAHIFMDVWARYSESWLGQYDGKIPLYAYYDWISYTSLEDMKKNNNK